MNEYLYLFTLYSFYQRKDVWLVRVLVFFLFPLLLLSLAFPLGIFHWVVRLLVVLFCFFLINEAFVEYRVKKVRPKLRVQEASDLVDAMVFSARFLYENSENVDTLARALAKQNENISMTERIGSGFSVVNKDYDAKELLSHAAELVKSLQGRYVTEVDLFAAYLILSEEDTKYLQNNDLKTKDIASILYWIRNLFPVESVSEPHLRFEGSSFGEALVFGWDLEIKKYTLDLTSQVLSRRYPPKIVGREKEYEELLSILSKEKNNNAILVGEPGTGKRALIDYFAYKSHLGEAPNFLSGKRVFELLADRLIAGAQNQGELQERIGFFFSDVQNTGNAVVCIQNIENIFGGGGYNFDVSGVILEYLEDAITPFIGTTTPSLYRTFLEKRGSILDMFEEVRIEEPSEQAALLILFEKIGETEHEHHVKFTYNAVKEAVTLSSSYLLDTFLPGKALNLLDEVAAENKLLRKEVVEKNDVIKKIEERTNVVIASPTSEEKEKLLHLEEEIHKRIIDQEQAVGVIAEALRRLRSGFVNQKRPISVFLFLGPTGVGKTETAKALASIYFGSENRMIRLDMSEYQTQESIKRLLGSLPGEEDVPSRFTEDVRHNPFSVILLDEFEKAHPRILDVFLQVFEDGRLTDNRGHTVSFKNTIIIATSNAGSEYVREKLVREEDIVAMKKDLLDYLQKEQMFRPELLNRFDDIVIFKPLGPGEISQIAKLILSIVLKNLEDQEIYIGYDKSVIEKVSREAFDKEFGARNVRRYITSSVENFLSRMILENKIKKGDRKTLTVDKDGAIVLV